jgi:chromosome segregation ATPase
MEVKTLEAERDRIAELKRSCDVAIIKYAREQAIMEAEISRVNALNACCKEGLRLKDEEISGLKAEIKHIKNVNRKWDTDYGQLLKERGALKAKLDQSQKHASRLEMESRIVTEAHNKLNAKLATAVTGLRKTALGYYDASKFQEIAKQTLLALGEREGL